MSSPVSLDGIDSAYDCCMHAFNYPEYCVLYFMYSEKRCLLIHYMQPYVGERIQATGLILEVNPNHKSVMGAGPVEMYNSTANWS